MAWFPSIRPPGGTLALVLASKIALAVVCLVLSGCASSRDAVMARVFEAPNVIHVCVRPPNVPKDKRTWGLDTSDGSPFFEAPAVALARRAGRTVYIFDPDAPPESVRLLPIPHNTLECPAPPKPRVVAAKVEGKKEPAKKAEAKKAERPKPLPAAKHCASYGEPGQTRRRSGSGAPGCTRVLVKRPRAEQTVAANRRPATGPIPIPKPPTPERIESTEVPWDEGRVYDDWRLTSGEAAQLDRVRECVQGVCHSRHRNFVPKGHKETAGKHDGHALSTGSARGGGASPPRPVRTTKVKTTTKPVAKPNGGAAGQAGQAGNGSAAEPPPQAKPKRGGETPAAARGREAHEEFKKKVKEKEREGWRSEPRIDVEGGGQVRPDAVTPKGNPIELKPNTPTGRAAGKRQIKKYEDATGERGRVIYYDP